MCSGFAWKLVALLLFGKKIGKLLQKKYTWLQYGI